MAKKYDAVVLGGGIIGCSVARELQARGQKVLLIERGGIGQGCSYGNAGWVTPCFAMPLPQPGLLLKSIKWLFDDESPLYIKPEPNWLVIRWLLHFMSAMNYKQMKESIAVLAEISKWSLKFYSELAQKNPHFGFDQKGLLMVSGTQEGCKATVEEMNLMKVHGIEGRELKKEEILNMEPSLKPVIQGGVYFPTEAHVEPLLAVQAIFKEFESLGGELFASEIFDFETDNGKITKIKTTKGDIEAPLVVMALGTWSEMIAKRLSLKIPILGGKGYSLIVEKPQIQVRHPIMILEKKIAVTPRENSLRLAGTLELVRNDFGITPKRVRAIEKGSKEFLRLPEKLNVQEVWRGLRPCTPDGVPLIGFSKKWSNLFYCTGHQMLGLQSAPGSAMLAADLISGKQPQVDARPFRSERYE